MNISVPSLTGMPNAHRRSQIAQAFSGVPNEIATRSLHHGHFSLRGLSAASPTVSLVNASRPGQPFQVGDSFTLQVTGAPGQTVAVQAKKNGQAGPSGNMGKTDADGNYSTFGTFAAGDVGDWAESWTVGGVQASLLTFSVVTPAPAAAPPPVATPPPAPTPPVSSSSSSTSTSTTSGTAATAGFGTQFMAGLSLWSSPTQALSAIPSSLSLIGQAPGAVLGLLTPPIALIGIAFMVMSKRKR